MAVVLGRGMTRVATLVVVVSAMTFAWNKGESLRKKSDSSEKPFMSEWNFARTFASFVSSALRKSIRLRRCAGTAAVLSFIVSCFTQLSRNRLGLMFFSSLWYIDYLLKVVEVPEVGCKGTFFNRRILSLMHKTLRRYSPCFWLANSNFSTVGGALIRDAEFMLYSDMQYVTDTIKSYDGINTFTMDWYQPENRSGDARKDPLTGSDRPVVVLVHGLGGSSDEAYLKKIARVSHEHGWRCASFDYWRLDFAEMRDLDIALNRVRAGNPFAPIALVGISAGTHICMRYLEVRGKSSPVCCAVLQSSVFDLMAEYDMVRKAADAGSAVKKGYKAFMDNAIARMVRRHLRNDKRPTFNREAIERLVDQGTNADLMYDAIIYAQPSRSEWPVPATSAQAFADFRERQRKYPNPECCYAEQKEMEGREGVRVMCEGNKKHYSGLAMPYISSVEVTTLMIHARDDPVVGYHSIDWQACAANKNIITVKTNRGGHVGWLSGAMPFSYTWADNCTVDFIRSVLEVHSSTNFMLEMVRRMNEKTGLAGGNGSGSSGSGSGQASLYSRTRPSVEQMARICSASDLPSMDLLPPPSGSKLW